MGLPLARRAPEAAREIYENGGVVSSVCHGACGLLNITLSDGSLLIDGRTLPQLVGGCRQTLYRRQPYDAQGGQ